MTVPYWVAVKCCVGVPCVMLILASSLCMGKNVKRAKGGSCLKEKEIRRSNDTRGFCGS